MARTPAGSRGEYPDLKAFESKVRSLVADGFFRKGREIFINRTPGRLDLMGGNDDYSGGLVFETTIREATWAAVQLRDDQVVTIYNPGAKAFGWNERIELQLSDLAADGKVRPLEQVRDRIKADPGGVWSAYVLGDLYLLLQRFPGNVRQGFSLYVESDVPLGKGVSSSAALEVAPMKAMAAMYGLDVGGVELATWTQWVEIEFMESACGIMDQLAVVMGDEDYFVPMLCQPCEPEPLVRLPENLRIWGIDSGVRHSVAGIEYETARAATFMGYSYLCAMEGLQPQFVENGILTRWVEPRWDGYLARVSPSEFRARFEDHLPEVVSGSDFNKAHKIHLDPCTPVRDEVNYPVRAATRYAVEENWRVHSFVSLISKPAALLDDNTARLLGELMYQSHVAYSQCGLGSEATDEIVEFVRGQERSGLWGAKITGGGAGGTVAVLGANTSAAEAAFSTVVDRFHSWSGREPYVFQGSSAGCDTFGVRRLRV